MYLLTDKSILSSIFNEYKNNDWFFPLIGAVLEGNQEGKVYVDNNIVPTTVLVIHKFLFAQIISKSLSIKDFKKIDQVFKTGTNYNGESYKKLRFYCANEQFINYIIERESYHYQIGERTRFELNDHRIDEIIEPEKIDSEDISILNSQFDLDVCDRFWSNCDDFQNKSKAYCVKEEGKIKSICYSSAISDNKAEIDVATHVDHRKKGLAKRSVLGYVSNCYRSGLIPLWDCYSDNISSIRTAMSVGFKESFKHQFLIITKK